jgi:hypothetical protein
VDYVHGVDRLAKVAQTAGRFVEMH